MGIMSDFRKRFSALLTIGSMVAAGLAATVVLAPAASAVPGPIAEQTPSTVTSDPLPTVQMDGVAWSQRIIGNTVYVGGSFANARPAGAAPGNSLTARGNFLAYNLNTGNLITTISPSFNQQIYSVATAPDGSRVYVGGQFTTVNGATRNRIAALNPTTGAVITTFTASLNYVVRAIAVSNTTVYVAGQFTTANGQSRTRLAAYSVATGALTSWAPTADDTINAMVLSPDGNLIIGGSFQNVNGASAYGLAKLNASTGALMPWNTGNLIQNAGANSAILSLSTDGDAIYGTGYHFGAGGNLEGTFSSDPVTGDINWVEDCHGDTYDAWPSPTGVIYTVSHAHYCGNIGGFFQSDPWATNMRRALAFTKTATGTAGHDPHGYYDFYGTPSPSMYAWFPDLTAGTYTGKTQAAWTVNGNANYVVLGGEFPRVNNVAQQGLVRMAIRGVAPAKVGPSYSGSNFVPGVVGLNGAARISWQANSDRDNKNLTYRVLRNNVQIYTTTADSVFWERPTMGYIDSTVVPGTTYQYRITATDSDGNVATGNQVSFTAGSGSSTPYAQKVIADGAATYWPLNEATGNTLYDNVAFNDADATAGLTRGASGAIAGDTATNFNGSAFTSTRTAIPGPNTYTIQAWIKTTTTSGGKIIGFGCNSTGWSGCYDRQLYMDNAGRIWYGVYPNGIATLNSTNSYNDGQWHQISASLGADGMKLSIDGKQIATRGDVTWGQDYQGYWRVGGDNLDSWPGQPSSRTFAGDIDEVAIYPTVLSRQTIDAQWVASGNGRTTTLPVPPADAYGQAVYNDNPLLYWRLNDAGAPTAADSGPNGDQTGLIQNGVTFGQTGAISGTTNKAALFDGNAGLVASTNQFNNPKNYSEEAWFKTTTTSGGKIIGFGASQTGTSGGYDRHIYMSNDGKVTFGVWTGFTNTVTSPTALNDGQWHHVVATQSTTEGIKFYVDGALVGTNGQTDAQDYAGYWRVGGDNHWGCCSPFFNGTIDDAAVYSSVLTAAQVANHYALGANIAPPNQAPTANFTSSATNLNASFNGTGSTDPDGTIASYSWDFGDSTAPGSGSSPTHPYALPGTYNVTLTVTDNGGLTATKTNPITVTAANVAPVADFSVTKTGLKVDVDGGASTDSDGTVASYAWTFGDGATATGATATRTYAAGGTYNVTLTVTDNDGATNSKTTSVTVVAPNTPPTANFTVTPMGLTANFTSTSADSDGTIAGYAWNFGDGGTATTANPVHTYAGTGTYTVTLTVTDNQGGTNTATQPVSVTAPPANVAPTANFTVVKSDLTVNVESTSTDSDGTIAGYSWNFGDSSALVTTASATHSYALPGTYSITLTVTDDDGATATKTTPVTVTAAPPGNVAPVAAFTTSASGLVLSVNGSTSSDSDGTIAAYSWTFGDGSTDLVTTPTANHTYTADGTYNVSLTVTDDDGATNTLTKSVTVSSPAPAVLAQDTFTRTTANGWGAADLGGGWTITGGNTNYSVGSGTGKIRMATAGSGPTATLGGVSQTNTDTTLAVSLDKAPTGGGVYVSLASRKVGTSEYRATAKFLAGGSVQLQLVKIVNGTSTSLQTATVAGYTYVAGDQATLRFRVSGAGSTALSAKIWKTGTTEPASFQVNATDAASPLTAAGSVALYPYLTGSSTNAPVTATFDNLKVSATA